MLLFSIRMIIADIENGDRTIAVLQTNGQVIDPRISTRVGVDGEKISGGDALAKDQPVILLHMRIALSNGVVAFVAPEHIIIVNPGAVEVVVAGCAKGGNPELVPGHCCAVREHKLVDVLIIRIPMIMADIENGDRAISGLQTNFQIIDSGIATRVGVDGIEIISRDAFAKDQPVILLHMRIALGDGVVAFASAEEV